MPTSETYRVPASLNELVAGRVALKRWLGDRKSEWPPPTDSMMLVFTELLTNAIEASGPDGTVSYAFQDNGCEIALRFVNTNPKSGAVELRSMPDAMATSGRGLALAQQFSDRLDINSLGAVVDIAAHFFTRPVAARPVVERMAE